MVPEISSAPKAQPNPVIKVWDVPTRVFHWLMALSFAGAYLTAESERVHGWHVMFGLTLAALVVFRVFWGIVGTRYARFSSFLFRPARVLQYGRSLLGRHPEHYIGHNPAGAVAIFLLLGLGGLTALSGLATELEVGGEWLGSLHEGVAATLLTLVGVHLLGVGVSSLRHGENLVRAMWSGNKSGPGEAAIPKTRAVTGVVLLLAVLGFWTADRAGWLPPLSGTVLTQPVRHDHH